MSPRLALLLSAALLVPAGTAFAKKEKAHAHHDTSSDVTVIITGDERTVIRDGYGADHGKPLPPGLQKKLARGGDLPPGWQKKLSRGAVVPADIWAVRQPLSSDVLRRLPPQPAGVVTVRVDNQILRVATATMILLDLFEL